MGEEVGGKLVPETVEVTNVHSNLSQEIIKITTDKLKLILKDHLPSHGEKEGMGDTLE